MRILSTFLKLITAIVLIAIAGGLVWKRYDDRRLLLLGAGRPAGSVVKRQIDPETGWGTVTLADWEGNPLPCRIAIPTGPPPEGGFGCVIANYGIGQRVNFFNKLAPFFTRRGLVFLMPEQYGCGERHLTNAGFFETHYAPRKRAARLVAETRLWVDFVETLPEVDRCRIDYLGISYGGIVGATLLAKEPRFRNAVFVMAGGNIPLMLNGLLSHYYSKSFWVPLAASLGGWWLAPFEPLEQLPKANVQRLLFLAVEPDELIPPESRQALVRAATVPFIKRVYPGPHTTPNPDTVAQMVEDLIDWLKASPR